MMCQIIGIDPISINGFGLNIVSSEILLPSPPAKITAFIIIFFDCIDILYKKLSNDKIQIFKMKNKIPIFIISLKNSARLPKLIKRLNELNLKYKIFYGVTGKQLKKRIQEKKEMTSDLSQGYVFIGILYLALVSFLGGYLSQSRAPSSKACLSRYA